MKPLIPALILTSLALAACNTPSPAFMGVAPERVTVDGSTFDVRQKGTLIQALRVNTEFAPNMQSVAPRALEAMRQVSGCAVADGSLTGDQVIMTAQLEC